MPSADKLFTLDPVDTQLSKTTTSVSVQGPVNRSAENALFTKGLQSFASSLGSLGEASKQKQIIEDTRLAENAAIRGETRPSGILDVASEKFDNIVDANFADKTLGEIKAFVDGTSGHDLINNTGELSAKLQEADRVFDGFAATGLNGIRNNTTRQLFASKAIAKRDEVKRAIRDVDDDHNKSEVIHRIKNLLESSITTSKAVNEPLSSAITTELLDGLSKQALELNMGLGDKESKLLLIQLASQNPDVIADPELMNSLFNAKFNKGVTYMDLYVKGLQVGNKDQDAASAVSIIDRYNKASQQHFLALEKQDKEDRKRQASEALDAVATAIDDGKSNGEVYAIAEQNGVSTEDTTKQIKIARNKLNNLQEAKGGKVGQSLTKQILGSGGDLREDEIRNALRNSNIRSEDHQFYMDLNKGEQEEFKSNNAAFNASIKQLRDKLPSLIRPALGDGSAPMFIGDVYNPEYAENFKTSKTADPSDVANSLVKLQDLLETYASRADSESLEATKTNDFDPKAIDKFAADFNTAVLGFIDDLEKGIITKAQEDKANDEAKAARKADKENKEKEAAAAKAGSKDDKPSAPLPIKEIPEIKKKTLLLEEPDEYFSLETEAVSQFLKQFQSKDAPSENPLSERPISSSEQTYLKSLSKGQEEVTGQKKAPEPQSPKSRTGLGPVVDALDTFVNDVGLIGDTVGSIIDAVTGESKPERGVAPMTVVDDITRERDLLGAFQSFFSPNEAGAADSSTDGFDPDAPGPSGFDKNNNPTNNEPPFKTINLNKGLPPLPTFDPPEFGGSLKDQTEVEADAKLDTTSNSLKFLKVTSEGRSFIDTPQFAKEHAQVRPDLKKEVIDQIETFTPILKKSNTPLVKTLEILTEIEDGGDSASKTKFVHRSGDKAGIYTAMFGVTTKTANAVLGTTFTNGSVITTEQAIKVVEASRKENLKDIEKVLASSNIELTPEQKIVMTLLTHNAGMFSVKFPAAARALKADDLDQAKIEMFSKAKGPNNVGSKFEPGLLKKNNMLLGLFERLGK